MTKHTPGPWDYQGCMNSRDILVGPIPPGRPIQYGEAVATVKLPNTPEYCIPEPRAMANARLIAAAPELLEALQGLLSSFMNDEAANAKARAAIAKATGGSS